MIPKKKHLRSGSFQLMLCLQLYSFLQSNSLRLQFILLLAFVGLFTGTGNSQSFRTRIGLGYVTHNANISEDEPVTVPTVPSMGVFYDDNLVLGSEVMVLFSQKPQVPILSLTYEYHSLAFSKPIGGIILGSTLDIHSISASAGFGFNYGVEPGVKFFNYFTAGYVAKFYSGESQIEPSTVFKNKYEKGGAFRLGTGMHFTGMFGPKVSFAIGATYDFGTVRRGNIDIYKNDEYSSSLIPTGDMVLPDNVLNIQIGVCYDIRF